VVVCVSALAAFVVVWLWLHCVRVSSCMWRCVAVCVYGYVAVCGGAAVWLYVVVCVYGCMWLWLYVVV